MNEERYIRSRMGDTNPFKVPEGYFDHLANAVMQKLPERETPVGDQAQDKPAQRVTLSVYRRLRPYIYLAACLVVAVFTMAVFFNDDADKSPMSTMTSHHVAATESFDDDDEIVDYTMVDNYDIYACLTND